MIHHNNRMTSVDDMYRIAPRKEQTKIHVVLESSMDTATGNASRPQSTPPTQATPDRAPTRCHDGYVPHYSRHCIFLRYLRKRYTKCLHAKLRENQQACVSYIPEGPRLTWNGPSSPINKRNKDRPKQDAMVRMLMDSIGPELHTETCIAYAICTRPKRMRPS